MNLAYLQWDPSPTIVDLGFISLRWYSLCFALGTLLAYALISRSFRQDKRSDQQFEYFALYMVVGMMLGMRIGHFLFYEPGALLTRPWEVLLPISFTPTFHFTGYQGLASHGGAIGVLLAVFFYHKKYPTISVWYLLDQLAWVTPLLGVCIRTGNLLNAEIIGRPTNVPWAFVFTQVDDLPRHPAQLYEALSYLVIFLLLQYARKTSVFQREGRLFAVLLILLFTARFIIEFFKEDQVPFEQGLALNMGQLLSVPFVLAGGLILVFSLDSFSDD